MNVSRLLVTLSKVDKSLFDIPVEIQKDFLDSQSLPQNHIDRSYNQYKAQMLFVPSWKIVLQNLVASIFLPFTLVYLLMKSICDKKGVTVEAAGEFKGLEEVLPHQLTKEYNINNDVWGDGSSLVLKDFSYILRLAWFRHPYFVQKSIMKIAMYSHSIRAHSPKAIVVHNEYSFTSSMLTGYCHHHGVKHINAMHGEKLFYIRDSWFKYDECYVWDEHYVNLFIDMKAEPTQFIIAVPPSLSVRVQEHVDISCFAHYKYYLTDQNEEEIKAIVASMSKLCSCGYTIKYRPHPRFSDMDLIEKYIPKEKIEYPRNVSILKSISNLDYAVGLYSTVLLQTHFAGNRVVLDNITYPSKFNQLKALGYLLLSSKCDFITLSQLVNNDY